jgi:hypothetical protein
MLNADTAQIEDVNPYLIDILIRETKAIPNFRLNSNGGDIEIAIAIGHNFGNFMRQL